MGIKKIEQDAEENLSLSYINEAKYDSSICDLILSGCKFRTEVIKRAFWYDGEILEKGTPRNDVLFQDHAELKQRIFAQCDIPKNAKILLYAPTFRKDMGLQYYKFNWMMHCLPWKKSLVRPCLYFCAYIQIFAGLVLMFLHCVNVNGCWM